MERASSADACQKILVGARKVYLSVQCRVNLARGNGEGGATDLKRESPRDTGERRGGFSLPDSPGGKAQGV